MCFYGIVVYFKSGLVLASKIEEILPKIFRQLSSGSGVSTVNIENDHGLSASSVRAHLRSLKENFFPKSIKYDGSTKKWVAIEPEFLKKSLLKPEEIVILNGMLRNKSKMGSSLTPWHEQMVNSYVKRTKSYIFKQHTAEEITGEMEHTFAILQNAIDDKKKVELEYSGKMRTVYPYKIVYIEYYWYLICYEESASPGIIKSLRVSKIVDPYMLDETFSYDFDHVDKRLNLAMNAYVDFQNPFQTARAWVSKEIKGHVVLAAYFKAWKELPLTREINNVKFTLFDITFTNPDFNDVIPTILKYMPNILVEEPIELKEEIDNIIKAYTDSYL